jgi:hypothetical protein
MTDLKDLKDLPAKPDHKDLRGLLATMEARARKVLRGIVELRDKQGHKDL